MGNVFCFATRVCCRPEFVMHSSAQAGVLPGAHLPTRIARSLAPNADRDALLALARRPAYGVSLALAGVAARSWELRGQHRLPFYGLDAKTTHEVFEDHFPGSSALAAGNWNMLEQPAEFRVSADLSVLISLLQDARTVEDEDSKWLAHAVATACLGKEALWSEMNLPSPGLLRELMHGFFTSVAVRNRNDEEWKPFLMRCIDLRRQAGRSAILSSARRFAA